MKFWCVLSGWKIYFCSSVVKFLEFEGDFLVRFLRLLKFAFSIFLYIFTKFHNHLNC